MVNCDADAPDWNGALENIFIKFHWYQYPHVVLTTYLIFSHFSVVISMQTVTDSEGEIEMK